MSAAPDPASLDRLHDLVAPAPVPWWPPAPGWYLVGGVVLVLLGWFGWRSVGRWRRNAYRRAALAELAALEIALRDPDRRPEALGAVPALVKRTALAAFPREEVASLSGPEWRRFLDRAAGQALFAGGTGEAFARLAYESSAGLSESLSEAQIAGIVAAVRIWILSHRVGSAPSPSPTVPSKLERASC